MKWQLLVMLPQICDVATPYLLLYTCSEYIRIILHAVCCECNAGLMVSPPVHTFDPSPILSPSLVSPAIFPSVSHLSIAPP